MKRLSLAIILLCCTLAVAAQENTIRVKYQGAQPTITDFVDAYTASIDDSEEIDVNESANAFKHVWSDYRKGKPLYEGVVVITDRKNGYAAYESRQEGGYLHRVEACYWNEADKKHKIFAVNTRSYHNGNYDLGQYDGTYFYRYDNATKKMHYCEPETLGIGGVHTTEDGTILCFDLPRQGKNITVTKYIFQDNDIVKKSTVPLKWNGRKFSY